MKKKDKIPRWIKYLARKEELRKQYFIKRYGSLDRMTAKDKREQDRIDNDIFNEEINIEKP